jgi:hypothetical protein
MMQEGRLMQGRFYIAEFTAMFFYTNVLQLMLYTVYCN